MTTSTYTTTVGVFQDKEDAEAAIQELKSNGFQDDEIGLLAKAEALKELDLNHHLTGSRWEEGAGVGAVVGVCAGFGLGLILAVGMPVIAGGALLIILGNMAAGTVTGSIAGALIGMGVPANDAENYERELNAGKFIVTVDGGDRADEVRSIFQLHEV